MKKVVALVLGLFQYMCVLAGEEIIALSDTTQKKPLLPTLTIDRPDQTDSPYVIPVGFFQIETGIQHVWDKYREDGVNYSYRSFAYPNLLLRYGVFRRVEIRLEENYSRDRISSEAAIYAANRNSGWHPTLFAAKILLFEQKGWRPNLAILAKLSTPYHSRKRLDLPYKYTPGLVGAFSHSISDRFVLDGSVGGMMDQLTGKVNMNYSLSQAIALTKKLSLFVEVFGYKPAEVQAQYSIDMGFLYMLLPNVQIDVYGSKSLSYHAADIFAGAGVGVRLPR